MLLLDLPINCYFLLNYCCYFSWIFNFLLVSTYLTRQKMRIRGRDLLWYIELFLVRWSVCLLYFWSIIRGNGHSGLVHVRQLFALSLKSHNPTLWRSAPYVLMHYAHWKAFILFLTCEFTLCIGASNYIWYLEDDMSNLLSCVLS